jgi:hypothetical protein
MKNRGKSGSRRSLTVAERRIKSAARGGADVGPAGLGSVRSAQIFFSFSVFLFLS